ncbi:MAG: hypothetical protein U0746_10520 [Gemmataceae bacterium]
MASTESSINNFGLLIAYVLPGFTAVQGLPFLAANSTAWGANAPSLPGLVSGTLAAVAAGLTVSAVRWLVVDTLHHRTGLRPPEWDFARLEKNAAAYELLVQIHYWYYKFYANMVVALVWAVADGGHATDRGGVPYWLLAVLFFWGSRDALRKYYARAGRLLAGPGPVILLDPGA